MRSIGSNPAATSTTEMYLAYLTPDEVQVAKFGLQTTDERGLRTTG